MIFRKTVMPGCCISGILLFILMLGPACSTNGKKENNSLSRKDVKPALSDTLAAPAAARFYQNLHHLSGNGLLIGHQDALAYGIGWSGEEFRSDINDVCGDFPAVFGWDLGHLGEPENIDGVPFASMITWAIEAYKRGGINTYSWHMKNIGTGGSSWDITPCVEHILPGGSHHDAFLKKLDLAAEFFSRLKSDNGDYIPVIFRPFHEMNGGWFWWGSRSCNPEEYKLLFRFTVDYFRNVKGIHQLIYVYSPDLFRSSSEYLLYYPGDEYIDVLGVDDYKGLRNRITTNITVNMLEILDSLACRSSKLIAVSETGSERLLNDRWFTEVVLPTIYTNSSTIKTSWILFWRNGRPDHFYVPYPGHPAAEDFIKFKEDSLTLFLSDIKNIYN